MRISIISLEEIFNLLIGWNFQKQYGTKHTTNPDRSEYFLAGLKEGGASILLSTNKVFKH